MNYLLDKKIKRKKYLAIVFLVIVFLILFYFRVGIFRGLAYAGHTVFRPVLILGNNLSDRLGSVRAYFTSKNSLFSENENLKIKINEDQARISNYNSILAENINLKEILGRKNEKTVLTLSAVLSKPNQSLYDTLIIDAGIKQGLRTGDMVFALGNVPIGRIATVYSNSSKVILFSNSGEKTQVVMSGRDIFLEIIGRGGGNFEMILPRDFTPLKGEEVVLSGLTPYVVGVVQTIISDPRDPFIKALLTSPVNIQELKFVEVETQK